MTDHIIPPPVMVNPMWNQPDRREILVNGEVAIMSEQAFYSLKEYSTTNPTGVTPGKMWKLHQRPTDKWYLCWYGPEDRDQCCFIYRRPIQIMDWIALMGITS